MASSPSDQKKDSCQSSVTNDSLPGGGPHPTGYPPMMGYPMGYPPGPAPPGYPSPSPGQQGYPNYSNGYNNNYPYTQAPPASYYNPHLYNVQQESPVSSFIRGVIGGLVLLIIFMCIASILMWLILRPAIPVMHVDTLSVSNFNGSSSFFTADWDAKIAVENPNTKLKIYFDQIQVFLYFDESDLLASSFAHPFLLETHQNNVIKTKLAANNSDHTQAGVGSWVVEKMANDKSTTGKLHFGLRMAIWSTFKSGTWWAKHATIRVYCEDLEVVFGSSKSNGKLNTSNANDCLIFA